MGRTTAGWRAPPAPASPGAAAGRPAPAPARHSLGPAWRCLRPLAAARHCARPWWSSPLLVVRRARCPGKGGDLERCYPPVTYPGYLPGRSPSKPDAMADPPRGDADGGRSGAARRSSARVCGPARIPWWPAAGRGPTTCLWTSTSSAGSTACRRTSSRSSTTLRPPPGGPATTWWTSASATRTSHHRRSRWKSSPKPPATHATTATRCPPASRSCAPRSPISTCIDLDAMTALVRFAADNDVVLVHDFAYSDTAFDGYSPPSVLQVPGAKECSVELYTPVP